MIRFNGRSEGGRLLIGLGISKENVKRLKEGKPIHISADEMGFEGDIMIFYGETEDAMAAELKESMEIGTYHDKRQDKRS